MENTTTKSGADTNVNNQNVKGDLTYEDKVIQKIIGIALENIDGLLTVDGGFFSNMKEKLVNTDDMTAGISTEVGKKQVAVDMDIVVEYSETVQDKVISAAQTTGKFAAKQTDRAKNALSNQKAKTSDQLNSEPRVH